jgi:hypothetical protein
VPFVVRGYGELPSYCVTTSTGASVATERAAALEVAAARSPSERTVVVAARSPVPRVALIDFGD